eukprot:366256-Chlamydomonas_euryale.AAC.25
MFDGSVLHGVVPGHGPSPDPGGRRVTFMIAFWRSVRMRPRSDGLPGASQPFPPQPTPSAWPAGGEQACVTHSHPSQPCLPEQPCANSSVPATVAGAGARTRTGSAPAPPPPAAADTVGSGAGSKSDGDGGGCGDCAAPGTEHFGTTMVPSWRHTWQSALHVQTGSEWDARAGVGCVGSGGAAVAPVPVAAVWEEVDARTAKAGGHLLRQLRGLPKYEHCFQGF